MTLTRRAATIAASVLAIGALGLAPASAEKPSQGSTFDTGTCTTTTGHGSNAVETTDNGACTSADNPNKGTRDDGINTGQGFKPKPGNG
ncbi:MAG TPA: hypothetical protein VK402_05145 [Blastococcus sp.]|nr:hypothetical protein [Blastococcus sp.]